MGEVVQELPAEKIVKVGTTYEEFLAQVNAMSDQMSQIPAEKTTKVLVSLDGGSMGVVKSAFDHYLPDEKGVKVYTNIETASLGAAAETISRKIPETKEIEIQAKLDVARIEADAKTVQTAVEWKAKLDIAAVEAALAQVKEAFTSVDTGMKSTGETLSSLADTYSGASLVDTRNNIENQINQESARRDTQIEQQEKLTQAQLDFMNAKTEALKNGDAMITVNAPGLKPHLEAFMWEIIGAIQVRANEEASEFLLGI